MALIGASRLSFALISIKKAISAPPNALQTTQGRSCFLTMPSSSTVPRRRQRSGDDEDSDDTSSVSTRDPTPASQASNASKRIRLESATATQENDEEDEDSGESTGEDTDGESRAEDVPSATQETNAAPTNSFRNFPSGTQNGTELEAFKPGAIVRIKVTDFVTYTSAEFFPGPKLNMVIGPNGTGKSTLVCAICLGLGWGPQHLGRAKDPGEFVKHGCREAHIEIELAGGPRFRRNPVVSRTIKRDGNKSTFTLNGAAASRTQVQKLAQSFAIQIDNLCQFLPQDKVSEFAALTPIELLNSTQRAAAGPEMIEWHDNLKRLRNEQKKLQMDNQGDKDLLANLNNRQEMQRADVERMRQRAVIKRKIEMLEFVRPLTKYKEVYRNFREMKENKERISRELEDLKKELEPALRAVNAKQDYCVRLKDVVEYKKRGVEAANVAATTAGKKIEEFQESMKDLDDRIEAEKKSGAQHRQNASKIQAAIHKLNRQLNEEQVEFDVNWYNEKIREKKRELREIADQANEIKEGRRPLFQAMKEKSDQIKQTEQQLQGLDSQSGRQEAKLQQLSYDSMKAFRWLRQNQNKFEKEVFGPPIITCSVKDPKYANALESLLSRTDFTAFTVQTRNDFKTLQRALNIEMKLHDISIRTATVPLENFRTSMSEDQLKRMGFDGWAKNFINGPDPILSVLCSESRFHQTPVSLRDMTDEEYNIIEKGPVSSWVAGKHSYQITRRKEYGPGATSTRVRQVKPAKMWTSQPVEATAKQDLIRNIQVLKDEVREVQEKMESEKARLGQLGQQHETCEKERIDLEREKGEKQTALTNYRAIPERLRQQESKRQDVQRFFEEIKTRVSTFRQEQDELSIQKAEATIEYAKSVEHLRVLHEEHIKLSVRHVEGISDLDVLVSRNTEHRERLQEKTDELKEAVNEIKATSEQVKKLTKEAERIVQVSRSEADLGELIPTVVERSVDQLEADIDSEKARLDMTHAGSSNIIKEFEDRERQIRRLNTKLADFQTQLADYNHAIDEIRGQWEPRLDELVKSISDAFSDSFARIGCAGQVSLDKAEEEPGPDGESGGSNYDQWSIQIHVKFRENENLSLLDSHRQSGGERAVSTIFYLMALQSLSASPFRVVDEINQGMDPRNERMVHGRLVDIACAAGGADGGGGGQYFLITPKLLSGLVYKPGMRVLCIVSGEHMPTDYGLADFGQAVKRMRAVAAKRGRGRAIGDGMLRSGSSVNAYA